MISICQPALLSHSNLQSLPYFHVTLSGICFGQLTLKFCCLFFSVCGTVPQTLLSAGGDLQGYGPVSLLQICGNLVRVHDIKVDYKYQQLLNERLGQCRKQKIGHHVNKLSKTHNSEMQQINVPSSLTILDNGPKICIQNLSIREEPGLWRPKETNRETCLKILSSVCCNLVKCYGRQLMLH